MSPFAGDARPTGQRGRQPRCTPRYQGGQVKRQPGGQPQRRCTSCPGPPGPSRAEISGLHAVPTCRRATCQQQRRGRRALAVAEAARARTEGAAHVAGARAPLLLLSSLASGNDAAALQKAHKSESRRGPPPHPLARARSTLPLCWLPLSPPTSGFPALSCRCRCLCLCPHLLSLLSLEKVFLTRVLTPF